MEETRAGGFSNPSLPTTTTTSVTAAGKGTVPPPLAAATTVQSSPWHSPVPYLFGGLAAMLGLIAFALLILACSYWKLAGHLENGETRDEGEERDLEGGHDNPEVCPGKALPEFEEKILVIMAGDVKPTFLATPAMSISKASSFPNAREDKAQVAEKPKTEVGLHDQTAAAPAAAGSSRENTDCPENQERSQ
ncbi:protein GLUTAMINE DUMPER 2-like [Diospyros lotus]|uniref:protein GLUTAMINE DUMPER 2-like n=1 Tax=Diospyros lotus TaxID=55363 RepID=UPI00224D3380|nr:protein GLUTAMINE DUMPER 2-like [Diospyros lotus]